MSVLCTMAATGAFVSIVALVLLYDIIGFEIGENWSRFFQGTISEYWMVQLGCDTVILFTFVYLAIIVKGKITWFDKIFTEIQFVVLGLSVLCFVGLGESMAGYLSNSSWFYGGNFNPGEFDYYFISAISPLWVQGILTVIGLILLIYFDLAIVLSIIKKIKENCFWSHSICGGAVIYLIESFKANENIFWKVMIILILGCLLSTNIFGATIVLICIFIFIPKMMNRYGEIRKGVEEVKSGNLNYKIPVTRNGELDRLAMGINQISEASNIAFKNEIKNQRMKTDLISNVSHDLKTPLTSMVTYVDLLKTEGLSSENAEEYLGIIEEKTKRLQKLTEDLFEAAKASSGAIPVNFDNIEMISMVNQSLGELEELLTEKELKVIFNTTLEKAYVMADGQLLWRVIENILVNVSKYALEGSRVYMDLVERPGNLIVLEVKNISKDQLNINADELMERFKRGDESRTTEGSGLGLAIAKDLTKLMNGFFEVKIDGDLFKSSIALTKSISNSYTKEEEEVKEEPENREE